MPVIRGHRATAGCERGFTLIEVVIAALVIMLIGAAVATALIATTDFSGNLRLRSRADELAQQDQERLMGMSDQELNTLNQIAARTIRLDGATFTITSSAAYLNSSGASSCSGSTPQTAYYRITSAVDWPSNSEAAITEQSVIARPIAGNLLAEVQDPTGAGLPGATVSVAATGQVTQTNVTDSQGCATFSGLANATYTLTFTDPGYVDTTGNASHTASVTVPQSGSLSPVTLGQAGTITAKFSTQATNGTVTCPTTSGLCAGQQADALSWQGAGTQQSMSLPATYQPSSPAAQITAAGLFPFAFGTPPGPYNYTGTSGNYQVWAGKCAQMQPPATYDKFSVGPGSVQTVTAQEPALAVTVQYTNASHVTTSVAPKDIKLSFTSTANTPCSDSWYAPVASDAASDANGALAFPGQPYSPTSAPLKVCADYVPPGSSTYVHGSVSTANANLTAPTPALITTSKPGKC